MKRNSILLCLLLMIVANSFTIAKAQAVNVNDSLALVDLYNSTNGPGWRNHDNWLAGPVKTWFGITVNNTRVTEIHFFYNNLNGSIPVSIGNLTGLTDLLIESNTLNSTIPLSIGNLTSLISLNLSFNELNGIIPDTIGNLTQLQHLSLYGNNLQGSIPASIGNLARLIDLSLSYNQLTGTIPAALGNLSNISSLEVDNNQLTGAIPSAIGNLKKLQYLYLHYNKLSGEIPTSFLKLKALVQLYAQYNQLTQNTNLPVTTLTFPYLQVFVISFNRFTFDGLEALAGQHFGLLDYRSQARLPIHQSNNILSVSAGGSLYNNTYKWIRVGQADTVFIKRDSTFHPTQSGKYFAKIGNSIAKQLTLLTDTVEYIVPLASSNAVASSAKASQYNHFAVYPKPASSSIHIQTTGTATIILTNAAGKTLLTKTINNSADINVSTYANGVYYIQNKTTGETQKIIITH